MGDRETGRQGEGIVSVSPCLLVSLSLLPPPAHRPLQHVPAVAARADGAAVLAYEGLDGGGAVHVGDGDDGLAGAGLLELFPAVEGLVEVGHVGHGAAGAEVGEDDADVVGGEDVGGFGHEVDAAEDDIFSANLVGGFAGELEAVAGEVGEIDDGVLLVVMAEDDELAAQCLAGGLNAEAQFGVRESGVDFGEGLLPDQSHEVLTTLTPGL